MESLDRRGVLYALLASGAAVLAGCGTAVLPSQAQAAPSPPWPLEPGDPAFEAALEAVSADLVTRTGGNGIALTFDDGPGPETDDILDILSAADVKAVFCVVGKHAQQYPGLIRRIVAEGHALGNHSWDHDHDLWKLGTTAEGYRRDLIRASEAIRAAAPGVEIPFFRAPFGAWGTDRVAARAAAGMGMTPLSWTFSVVDWHPLTTEESIYQRVTNAAPGDIVLLHDADDRGVQDRERTVWAVRRAIPAMKRQGRTFGWPGQNAPTPTERVDVGA
jgi:peptidoglycan/xylan/chitin deacetylase (PgdA/CDA1 family)